MNMVKVSDKIKYHLIDDKVTSGEKFFKFKSWMNVCVSRFKNSEVVFENCGEAHGLIMQGHHPSVISIKPLISRISKTNGKIDEKYAQIKDVRSWEETREMYNKNPEMFDHHYTKGNSETSNSPPSLWWSPIQPQQWRTRMTSSFFRPALEADFIEVVEA